MDNEDTPGQVSARMGRDVIKARLWVQVDGSPSDVAAVLERVAAVFAGDRNPTGTPDTREPTDTEDYHTQTGMPDEIKI